MSLISSGGGSPRNGPILPEDQQKPRGAPTTKGEGSLFARAKAFFSSNQAVDVPSSVDTKKLAKSIAHKFAKMQANDTANPLSTLLEKMNKAKETEPKFPPNVSYASIVIDSSIEYDKACCLECTNILLSKTPLITSTRTFINVMDNLSDSINFLNDQPGNKKTFPENDWLFFKNTTGDMIVALPRPVEPHLPTTEYLQTLGYDPANLEQMSLTQLRQTLDPDKESSRDVYEQKIADQLPKLFTQNPMIKKRFCILGHGSPDRGLNMGKDIAEIYNLHPKVVGLKISQFQEVLRRFEAIGVDYVNYKTCYGGGRNLMEVMKGIKPNFTISVCASGDEKVLTRFGDRKEFWKNINRLLYKGENQLTANDFGPALEHEYGGCVSGLPVVAVQGKPYFEAVGIQNKTNIISYQTLAKHEELQPPQPLQVREESLLIYPQVIKTPVQLQRYSDGTSQKFPYFISKVPDHNQTFFMKISTDAGSPKQVIQESLIRIEHPERGSSVSVFMVKELNGVGEKHPLKARYDNVMVVHDPDAFDTNPNFAIYQKQGKWYCLKGDVEKEVSQNAVLACVCYYLQKSTPTAEAIAFSAGEFLATQQTSEYFSNFLRDCFSDEKSQKVIEEMQTKSSSKLVKIIEKEGIIQCRDPEKLKKQKDELKAMDAALKAIKAIQGEAYKNISSQEAADDFGPGDGVAL